MLTRQSDGLGCVRGVFHAIRITVIVLLIGSAIAFILGKVLFGEKPRGNDLLDIFYPSDECMDWAIGSENRSKSLSQLDELWNERHGDLFDLKGTDNVYKAFGRIKNAYIEEHKFDWYKGNKGYLPVRAINERKSHGNERTGKNESGK